MPASTEWNTPAEPPGDLPADSMLSYDPRRLSDTVRIVPPREDSTVAAQPTELPQPRAQGATLVLRQRLGQGGFGEVWAAEQASLGRIVAAKRLRPDRLSGDAKQDRFLELMFRQEAETTAQLDHPNIVPVYDLGGDDSGRPVLAMKRVVGRAWDDIIMQEFAALAPADFLARHIPILMAMAQAVAFAHARGIVHRDLKPSQVMVGDFGEILLMDWGLAVCVAPAGQPDAFAPAMRFDKALATNPAGTPAFMAPEQTSSSIDDIGPWTDVYLLGATLYYLLTGLPPHHGAPRDAFRKAQLGDVLPPAAACPGRVHPAELTQLAMAAMRPAIADRIPSARAFHAALQEYLSGAGRRRESMALADEARTLLHARGGDGYGAFAACLGKLEQARALWSDNPQAAELSHAAIVAYAESAKANGDLVLAREQAVRLAPGPARDSLLAAVAEAEAAARHRERQRRLLRRLAAGLGIAAVCLAAWSEVQRREAVRQRAVAVEETRRAVAARAQADGLAGFMLNDLRAKLARIGRLDIMEDVAAQAADYFASLKGRDDTAAARIKYAGTLRDIASLRMDQGKPEQAAALYRQALSAAADTSTPTAASLLSAMMSRVGLASALASVERFDEALAEVAAADALAAEIRKTEAENPALLAQEAYLRRVDGNVRMERGEKEAALASRERAVELCARLAAREPDGEGRRYLAEALQARAGSRSSLGDRPGAVADYAEAAKFYELEAAADPGDADALAGLAAVRGALARAHFSAGNASAAAAAAEGCIAVLRGLCGSDPQNASWREELAFAVMDAGEMAEAAGRFAEAADAFRDAAAELRTLAARDGAKLEWKLGLASLRNREARILHRMGRLREAIPAFREAAAGAEAIRAADPAERWARNAAFAKLSLADALADAAEYAEAEQQARAAVRELDALVAAAPGNMRLVADARSAYETLAGVLALQNRFREAAQAAGARVALAERAIAAAPSDRSLPQSLALALSAHAAALESARDESAADAALARAAGILESAVAEHPADNAPFRFLAIALVACGAPDDLDRAAEMLAHLCAGPDATADDRLRLADALIRRAAPGDLAGARQALAAVPLATPEVIDRLSCIDELEAAP